MSDTKDDIFGFDFDPRPVDKKEEDPFGIDPENDGETFTINIPKTVKSIIINIGN